MWESTVTSSSGQTSTRSRCFKPADAAMSNGSQSMARAETEKAISKEGCTLKDFKLDARATASTMVCGDSTILTETKFHDGDSFETTVTYTDGGVHGVTQIKGRRTGAC